MGSLYDLALAGSSTRAEAVLAGWTESDRLHIAFGNGLDYLFGVALFGTLSLACVWASQLHSPGSSLGIVLSWVAWVGVLLDIPENTSYLIMIRGTTEQPWPALFIACTAIRHAILIACIGYVLVRAVRPRAA